MKKLFAILLVLAMLIPMGVVVQAEEAVETKPFVLIQWQGFESELSNVYQMPFFWANSGKLDTPEPIAWQNDYSIDGIAESLKEEFNSRPDGARFLNYCLVPTAFKNREEAVVFVDEGVKISQDWLHLFLTEYKSIGGKLDGLVVDVEFEDLYATYIHSRYAVNDPLIYDKIVKHPLYATDIRPELEARGFKFYPNVTEYTPEIYSIHPSAGAEYAQSRSIWDAVLRSYINGKVTEACSPVWEYYPDAIVSDYQSKNIKPWLKEGNDFGGIEGSGGVYTTAGNSNNENTYSVRPYNFFEDPTTHGPRYATLPGYNKAVYENVPFNYFMYDTNLFKNTYLAADGMDVSFWIAHHLYNTKNKNSVSMTPYYAETILHMGLLNPSHFLGYIIESEVLAIGEIDDYEIALQIVNDIMVELTRVVGAADRKPIDSWAMPTWNNSFIVSGMTAGGKNYWRLTPDTTKVSLENFQVQGASDPTFSVNGQTITFPQGKIIETGNVRTVGTCGYWIETPAGVEPTITRAANYHSVYPAYMETYDGYAAGMEYTFKNALPTACWEMKKVGDSSAIVQADPANANNQVLALKGNYTLNNVNMPQNITAGDSYAEHQAWEVTVTVPADMAADAEAVLLSITSNKKKITDGGFKIAGGKIYYSQNGEYVELAGVAATGGSKFTLKREMDFSKADAYTCDYYVYDATGKLIAKANDIAIGEQELPVEGITMSCSKVVGEALLLDNYKLYPTRVGTDFELYDAKTGMKVTDINANRTANTAYRFAWLNATQTEKTYSVVAAYSDGTEAVIKEIKLAPNMEGVITGIAEIAQDKPARIYLRCDSPADPEEEVGMAGDNTQQPGASGMDPMMIVLIAVAALVLIGAVVVVVISTKKPAKSKKVVVEETKIEEATETAEEPKADEE